jgi:hypothetical protein
VKTYGKQVRIIGLTITMLVGVICATLTGAAEPGRHADKTSATRGPESVCVQPFEVTIHQGPSAGLMLQGLLALKVQQDGRIDSGMFVLPDGSTMTVVGQTHGRGIHLLFDSGDNQLIYGAVPDNRPSASVPDR